MQANPPEIAFTRGSSSCYRDALIYLPEGVTITSAGGRCPFAAGGELGYRGFLEQCLVDITDSVNEDGFGI